MKLNRQLSLMCNCNNFCLHLVFLHEDLDEHQTLTGIHFLFLLVAYLRPLAKD